MRRHTHSSPFCVWVRPLNSAKSSGRKITIMELLDKSVKIRLCIPVFVTVLDEAKIAIVAKTSDISVVDVEHLHQCLVVVNLFRF